MNFVETFSKVELDQNVKFFSSVKVELKEHLATIKNFMMEEAQKNYQFTLDPESIQKEEVDDLGRKFMIIRQIKASYPKVGELFEVNIREDEM